MSAAEWDEEGYEPPAFAKTPISDRWEGEDEEEEVKDNWDDEEPEKQEEEAKPVEVVAAVQTKKKKNLIQTIAEKEERKRKELEEKRQKEEAAAAVAEPLSPEEAQAERLRQQKLQEEADLQLAKEAFGVSENATAVTGIDAMHPTSKEDFDIFRKVLVEKLSESEKSPHYINFLNDFFRELCVNLESEDIRKLGSNLNALFNEKVNAQKSAKQKKKKKGASLNVGKTDNYADAYAIEYADEYEDFI